MNDFLPSHVSDNDEAEISWFFNDVTLNMVIIVLLLAVIFASLISFSEGTQEYSETPETTETKKPADLSSFDYYGETGFPSGKDNKGLPIKDRFNDDLILDATDSIRIGKSGNIVWNFEELSNIREKKILRIYVDEVGNITYEDNNISIPEGQKLIEETSRIHNTFVELYIQASAPVNIYEQMRNQLWNETEAIHWRFYTY
jgi:hypothetical protein